MNCNKVMRVESYMPLWLAKLIRPLCKYFVMVPENELEQIAKALDEERYDIARNLLWLTKFEWGDTAITTPYQVMLDFLTYDPIDDEEFLMSDIEKLKIAIKALQDISIWTQEIQDTVTEQNAGVSMWRGCVATAKTTLDKINQ